MHAAGGASGNAPCSRAGGPSACSSLILPALLSPTVLVVPPLPFPPPAISSFPSPTRCQSAAAKGIPGSFAAGSEPDAAKAGKLPCAHSETTGGCGLRLPTPAPVPRQRLSPDAALHVGSRAWRANLCRFLCGPPSRITKNCTKEPQSLQVCGGGCKAPRLIDSLSSLDKIQVPRHLRLSHP